MEERMRKFFISWMVQIEHNFCPPMINFDVSNIKYFRKIVQNLLVFNMSKSRCKNKSNKMKFFDLVDTQIWTRDLLDSDRPYNKA